MTEGSPPAPPQEDKPPPTSRPRPPKKPSPALKPLHRLPTRRQRSAKTDGSAPPATASEVGVLAGSAAGSASGWQAAPGAVAAAQAASLRPFINLSGDYRFLRAGYWALVDAELHGFASNPSPVQAVTVQNAAACLLVAAHAGIPTVEWKVARRVQDVEPPALLVPVSGLTDAHYEVNSKRLRAHQWRSATQNGTRAALAVKLGGELRSMRMIVGVTSHDNYHLAWDVWRTFGVPLATIWYVETGDPDGPLGSKPLFLGLDPLPLHELSERDLRLYEEVSQRPLDPETQGPGAA